MPNAYFVAAGKDGAVSVSGDGLSWDQPLKPEEGLTLELVRFSGGKCFIGGRLGKTAIYLVSKNGKSWDRVVGKSKYRDSLSGIAEYKDRFFLFGGSGANVKDNNPFVISTTDGNDLSPQTEIGGLYRLRNFATDGKKLIGSGDRGRRSSSADGIKWTDEKGVKATDTFLSLAYGNGVFVGAGLHGMRMTSPDGLTWSPRIEGEEGEHIGSMLWTGNQFVGIGEGATYFSPNGTAWERKANVDAPTRATYGNNMFVGTRWKGRILVSSDAITWKEQARSESHLEAIGFGKLGS